MKGNFEQCLALTLKEEGGFSKHHADPGGMTNLGVTKATYEGWVGRKVDEEEMRALTLKDVTPIYLMNYWNRVRGEELPMGVDLAVFDLGVNSGTTTAIKFLQSALNIPSDGIFGPFTLKHVNEADPAEVIKAVCEERLTFLKKLSTFPTFGKGWTSRVKRVQENSLKMLTVGTKPALERVSTNVPEV